LTSIAIDQHHIRDYDLMIRKSNPSGCTRGHTWPVYVAVIKHAREHVRTDAACTGCERGSGCTRRTPHVFLARRQRPSRSRNVLVSGTRLEKRKSQKDKILRRQCSFFAERHKVDGTEIVICLSTYRLHPCQQDILSDAIRRRRWHRCALYRGHEIPCRLFHRVLPFRAALGWAFGTSTCKYIVI